MFNHWNIYFILKPSLNHPIYRFLSTIIYNSFSLQNSHYVPRDKWRRWEHSECAVFRNVSHREMSITCECCKFAVRIHERIRLVEFQKRRLPIDSRIYIYNFRGGLRSNVDASKLHVTSTNKKRIQPIKTGNREQIAPESNMEEILWWNFSRYETQILPSTVHVVFLV